MAISASHLVTGFDTTDTSSYSTASFTPSANQLILAAVVNSRTGGPDLPTLNGNGVNWVQVGSTLSLGSVRQITLWRAMGASPTMGQLGISFTQNQSGCAWSIAQFSGIDTSGTDGSAAVLQSATNVQTGVNTITVTLAAFNNSNNMAYGGFGLDTNITFTVGTGFTLLGQTTYSTPNCSIMTESSALNDTSVDCSWSGNHGCGGIAVEIKIAPVIATGTATSAAAATGAPVIVTAAQAVLATANRSTLTISPSCSVASAAAASGRAVITPSAWANQPFVPSGVHGGGAINVVVLDRTRLDRFLAGGDVAGVLGTVDGARTWRSSSGGFVGRPSIACIYQDPSDPTVWWAGVGAVVSGTNTANGGLMRSGDGGVTWFLEIPSNTISFGGNGNLLQEAGSGGPRSVGKLIVVDSGTIYAGTFSNGVQFASVPGDTGWLLYALRGSLVRCLVSDPTTSSVLWAGLHDKNSAISLSTWLSGKATHTTTIAHGFLGGDAVVISGSDVGAYNGPFTVFDTPTATTFRVNLGGGPFMNGTTGNAATTYGLWRIDSGGSAVQKTLPASVRSVEEILFVSGGNAYAACNSAGVCVSTDGPGWDTWNLVPGNSQLPTGSQWSSIDGYHDPISGQDILMIGCANPQALNGQSGCLYKSIDSGANWTCITADGSHLSQLIEGTATTWWMATSNSSFLLGGAGYTAHQITRDPATPGRWLVAGKAGIWITKNEGGDWNPAVWQLAPTAHRFAAIDPANSANIALWSDDWNYFGSTDGLTSIQQSSPDGITTMAGMDIADADSKVYVSGGSGGGGLVARASNPLGSFTNIPYTPTSTPRGLITGVDGSLNPVILIATPPNGIYAKVGMVAWAQVCNTAFLADPPGSPPPSYFAWLPGSPVVFAFDPNVGIMKNINYGATTPHPWFTYWAKIGLTDVAQIAVDSAGTLYVAVDSEFWVVTGADSQDTTPVTDAQRSQVLSFDPDALGISPGGIPAVALKPTRGVPGKLMRSFDHGQSWIEYTDDAYRSFSENVEALRATDDGWIVAGTNGNGAYVGNYLISNVVRASGAALLLGAPRSTVIAIGTAKAVAKAKPC